MEDVLYEEEVEKYREMRSAVRAYLDSKTSPQTQGKQTKAHGPEQPTIGKRIECLRIEADITQLKLCELVKLDPRTVQRHLAGTTVPSSRIVYRYEKLFSMLLKRQVVISKLP